MQGSRNIRRTWLYGRRHRRYAFTGGGQGQGIRAPALFAGSTLDAALHFAPGGWPQRSEISSLRSVSAEGGPIPSLRSLRGARTAYGQALSLNPWLRAFPLALAGVEAELDGDQWILRDEEGYLMPLPKAYSYGWHLQLLSSGDGSLLFGEWNGSHLSPLTIYHEGAWLALRVLRGQK